MTRATAKCENGSPKGNAGIQVFYKLCYVSYKNISYRWTMCSANLAAK